MTVEDREEKFMVRAALSVVGPKRPDTCPAAEDLAAFLDDRLSETEKEAVMKHLEACPDCYRNWLASAAAIEEEAHLDRIKWESRVFVVRGTRIEPAEAMNRTAMGLMRPGPPPVAEVEAQEELHKFLQCPWCDTVGWVPVSTDVSTGCRCSVCDGIFSF